jgi:hypothetical protein
MLSPSRQRLSTLAVLGCQLVGCTSWQMQKVSPEVAINGTKVYQVRLTRPDSSELVLLRPRIVGDSLIGESPNSSDPKGTPERVAFPLSDIQSVAVRRPDATRTTLLMVGVGAAVAGVIAATSEGPAAYFPMALTK